MWVYDQESLAFFAVNQAAIDHYGYTRECYLSMTIRDIRPDSDIPHLEQFIARYGPHLRKAGCWRHRKQDGTLIEVEIVTHDLQFNQRPARLFLVYDVTK
jgi:PAS domain S-box-containing protein